MSEIATTPGAVMAEALGSARTATIAAVIGIIGAAVSLQGLPLFFLAVSAPMSGLGVLLGIRQRDETAVLVGLTGIGLTILGLV